MTIFYVTPQGYYVIKVITSMDNSMLQGYNRDVYQGYYVTVTLTNHRPFQNRPTLDAKKMHFCSSESWWEPDIRKQRVENYRFKK